MHLLRYYACPSVGVGVGVSVSVFLVFCCYSVMLNAFYFWDLHNPMGML